MSLNINDLDITDTVLEIVRDVNSSYLHVFTVPDIVNPYEDQVTTISFLVSLPGFGFKQLKEYETRDKFGSSQNEFCSIIVGTPPIALPLNTITFLEFSDETSVVSGRLRRMDKRLSSLVYCYIERELNLPLTWEEAKLVIPPVL